LRATDKDWRATTKKIMTRGKTLEERKKAFYSRRKRKTWHTDDLRDGAKEAFGRGSRGSLRKMAKSNL